MSIMNVKTETFEQEVLQAGRPVLVDFWAPWCGYCKRIAPAVEQIASGYEDQIYVGKINIDEQPELAERFEIDTIPTLMLFKDGQAVEELLVAPGSKAQITEWMKAHGAL